MAAHLSTAASLKTDDKETTSTTFGSPSVKVPVLSKAAHSTCARRSKASPDRTKMPCRAALASPAITAVGVAKMNAHGQKTTNTVTARKNIPVPSHVKTAHPRAMTTSQVAHRSARRTMGAFSASASLASRIMRCKALSSQILSARMVKVPYWFTVPLITASPGPFSTGRLSPVITEVSTVVRPDRMVPSSGIVSPANTVKTSPTVTVSAETITSFPSRVTRAVRGVMSTSFSRPALARAAV